MHVVGVGHRRVKPGGNVYLQANNQEWALHSWQACGWIHALQDKCTRFCTILWNRVQEMSNSTATDSGPSVIYLKKKNYVFLKYIKILLKEFIT